MPAHSRQSPAASPFRAAFRPPPASARDNRGRLASTYLRARPRLPAQRRYHHLCKPKKNHSMLINYVAARCPPERPRRTASPPQRQRGAVAVSVYPRPPAGFTHGRRFRVCTRETIHGYAYPRLTMLPLFLCAQDTTQHPWMPLPSAWSRHLGGDTVPDIVHLDCRCTLTAERSCRPVFHDAPMRPLSDRLHNGVWRRRRAMSYSAASARRVQPAVSSRRAIQRRARMPDTEGGACVVCCAKAGRRCVTASVLRRRRCRRGFVHPSPREREKPGA